MADLRIDRATDAHGTWLILHGDLTDASTRAVHSAVESLLDEGVPRLTLDLRQVQCGDGCGPRLLRTVADAVTARAAHVNLIIDDAARDMLATANTVALFAAIDDAVEQAEAIEALLKDPTTEYEPPSAEAATWVVTDEPPPQRLDLAKD